MKLYYYPINKLNKSRRLDIASHCVRSLVAYSVDFIRDELCFIYLTSTSEQECSMRNCSYVENFSVLNIDTVLELLDFKKGD